MRMTARAHRKATNLSLRAELVRRAKELGLNLSEIVERSLEEAVRRAEERVWLAENEKAIADYNAGVEKRPLFGDDWRRF